MRVKSLGLVTEEGARGLVVAGFHVQIECLETATQFRNSGWKGRWVVHLVNTDSGEERTVIPLRLARSASGSIRFREFRTINGVVGFVANLGIRVISVPLDAGARGSSFYSENLEEKQGA